MRTRKIKFVPIPEEDFLNLSFADSELLLMKIENLSLLLESQSIDEEKTIFGSEPVFKHTFTEQELSMIKKKLFNLLEQL